MPALIPQLVDVMPPMPYQTIFNVLRNANPIALLVSAILLIFTTVGTWFAANFKK